jgi:hypothetical protein
MLADLILSRRRSARSALLRPTRRRRRSRLRPFFRDL